jgi:hypothetical protein
MHSPYQVSEAQQPQRVFRAATPHGGAAAAVAVAALQEWTMVAMVAFLDLEVRWLLMTSCLALVVVVGKYQDWVVVVVVGSEAVRMHHH